MSTSTDTTDAATPSGRLHALYKKYCVLTDWNIGVVPVTTGTISRLVHSGQLGPIRWLPKASPLNSRADPFMWPHENGPRIIFEEIDHWTGRGHISSLPLEKLMVPGAARREITQSYHLSYPFVLQSAGKWYCMPESARSGGIDLYLWNEKLASWQLARRLIDGVQLIDATLFEHENNYYLFATTRGDGSYEKLRIWWAPSLAGPWKLHAQDPVKTDLRSSRPAGPLFKHESTWYRPAQDCSRGYGGAVTINRLEVLDPEHYRETQVCQLMPDHNGPYPDGLHTLVVCDDMILVDGKRVGFSAALLGMKLARRLKGSRGAANGAAAAGTAL